VDFGCADRVDSWGTKSLPILHTHLTTLAHRFPTASFDKFDAGRSSKLTAAGFFFFEKRNSKQPPIELGKIANDSGSFSDRKLSQVGRNFKEKSDTFRPS